MLKLFTQNLTSLLAPLLAKHILDVVCLLFLHRVKFSERNWWVSFFGKVDKYLLIVVLFAPNSPELECSL
jgi:hypothetical protein